MRKYLFSFLSFSSSPNSKKRIYSKKKKVKKINNDYLLNKEKARILVLQRLAFYNKYYNFYYNRVSIRDQKTRWGSCSKKSNLNFNYRLVHLPLHLCDYVVVHELCHLQELNHAKAFWDLVAETLPNHKELRKELKSFRF